MSQSATAAPPGESSSTAAAAAPAVVAPGAAAPVAGAPAPEVVSPAPAQLPKVADNLLGDKLAPPAAAPAVPEKAPEPIDPKSYVEALKLPEGITADDPLVSAFLESAAGQRLGAESVQAVVDKLAPQMRAALTAPYEAWKTLQESWQTAVKADPMIGGDKLPGVVSTINQALGQVCGDALADIKTALDLTGAGNNPAIIKALYQLSKGLVEPSGPVTGTPPNPRNERNLAALLYPSAAKESAAG